MHEIGVTIVSLTLDGLSSNVIMLKALGVSLNNPSAIKSHFLQPVTKAPVVSMDPCHMLKLVRNTLADKGDMCEGNNLVKCKYIVSLHKLQESEGFHLGNRLRSSHVAWYKKTMNVRLAAQTLSEPVATSLEFCLQEV